MKIFQSAGQTVIFIKESTLQRDIRIRILNRRLDNLNTKIEKDINYLNNFRGNSEWNSRILSSYDFITPIDLKKTLNHCRWDSLQQWSTLFRYGGQDYTVRKTEAHFRSALKVVFDEKQNVYRSKNNYFYSCLNQRGLRCIK